MRLNVLASEDVEPAFTGADAATRCSSEAQAATVALLLSDGDGPQHIELGSLANEDVTPEPLTVMCGHGERAMTAASLLAARGHQLLGVLAGGPAEWAAANHKVLVNGP